MFLIMPVLLSAQGELRKGALGAGGPYIGSDTSDDIEVPGRKRLPSVAAVGREIGAAGAY
jgi:hypothetical protein